MRKTIRSETSIDKIVQKVRKNYIFEKTLIGKPIFSLPEL